jgi:endonuclease-3
MAFDRDLLRAKAEAVVQRLITEYGRPIWHPPDDPVAVLIGAILSQNTSDTHSSRAFDALRAHFPTWEAVMTAPTEAIEAAIRPGGLARSKAPRLQGVLRRLLQERGELSLNFLAEMPLEEAKAWLRSFPGVGAKTAAIVLLFSWGRPVFPVDTHIHRISRRLGLVPTSATPEQTEAIWEALISSKHFYPLHVNLIHHGRQVCRGREPYCALCILQDLCQYYQSSWPDQKVGKGSSRSSTSQQ